MCGCNVNAAPVTQQRQAKMNRAAPPDVRLLAADVQHEYAELVKRNTPDFVKRAFLRNMGVDPSDASVKEAAVAAQERAAGRNTPLPPPHVQAGNELCECQKASLKVSLVRWVEQYPVGAAGLALLGAAVGVVVAKAFK